jgi:hypothetical protein
MSVRKATRPAIFKWRQTDPELILCAVRWYLRYSLSLRDVEELLDVRGQRADHTTVWRWVQRYAPEMERRSTFLTCDVGISKSRRIASMHKSRWLQAVAPARAPSERQQFFEALDRLSQRGT